MTAIVRGDDITSHSPHCTLSPFPLDPTISSLTSLPAARFRAKKKTHIENVERNIRELESAHRDLEVEVNDLRKENGLLKEMVQLKYGGRAI